MTRRFRVSTWAVLPAFGLLTLFAAGCQSKAPEDAAVDTTPAPVVPAPLSRFPADAAPKLLVPVAAADDPNTPMPPTAPVAEAVEPIIQRAEREVDSGVRQTARKVEAALGIDDAAPPAVEAPEAVKPAADPAPGPIGQGVQQVTDEVKAGVRQTADAIKQGVTQEGLIDD